MAGCGSGVGRPRLRSAWPAHRAGSCGQPPHFIESSLLGGALDAAAGRGLSRAARPRRVSTTRPTDRASPRRQRRAVAVHRRGGRSRRIASCWNPALRPATTALAARRLTSHLNGPGRGLVEVVEIEHQTTIRSGEHAEVRHMGITAQLDRQTPCVPRGRGRWPSAPRRPGRTATALTLIRPHRIGTNSATRSASWARRPTSGSRVPSPPTSVWAVSGTTSCTGATDLRPLTALSTVGVPLGPPFCLALPSSSP